MTLVTLAVAVPLALVTVQLWPRGCVSTVTPYALPLVAGVAKVKLVAFALTARLLPPLFCRTSPAPVRPATAPPMVKVGGCTAGGTGVDLLPPLQPETVVNAMANRVKIQKLFLLIMLFQPFTL